MAWWWPHETYADLLLIRPLGTNFIEIFIRNFTFFHWRTCLWKCWLQNGKHFVQALTHWGQGMHICVSKLTIIGSDNGLLLGQCQAFIWTNIVKIVNWTLGNKLQGNLNQNLNIFIQKNAFENVVWKMAAILSGPQCVNVLNDLY